MEHKLGEIFQYNDEGNIVTLQVLEDNTVECKGCFFNDPVHKECFKEGTITGWCVGRNDGNSVKFIQVIMIDITLEEARELYKQDSLAREIALRAFPKGEIVNDYKQITSLPVKIDCRTERLYARLVTAYKQISEGRKVELTSKRCYLPEIVLATSTVPRCGEYKGKVVIDNETFSIYIRTRTALFEGRVGFENDGVYCGSGLLTNTWAFKEQKQAEHFVSLFYEELIYISLRDIYNVVFVDGNDLPF